ncbi:hypothetical protein GC163_13280 [bacterium]|nr:hypothetical protein [bacterium]
MAAKIDEIFIGIGGSTTQLVQQVNKASVSLKTLGSTALGIKSALVGFAAAVAGAAIVNSFRDFVQGGLSVIDTQTKLARNLGTTADEFVKWNYIAGLSGVTTEELEKAFEKLGINVASNSSTTANALGKLGLSITDLQQQDVGRAFGTVATQLSKVESAAQRNALAMQIFGKSGTAVMGVINNGPAAIAAMSAEAERLGLTFGGAGSSAEAANDAVAKVGLAIQGVAQTAAIELAPTIEAVANATTDWLVGSRDQVSSLVPTFETLAAWLQVIADVADYLVIPFKALWIAAQTVSTGIYGIVQGVLEIGEAFGLVSTETADYFRQLRQDAGDGLQASIDDLFTDTNIGESTGGFLDGIRSKLNAVKTAAEETAPAVGTHMAEEIAKSTEAATKYIDKLQTQIATFGMSSTAAEVYKLQQQGVDQALIDQAAALGNQLDQMTQAKKRQEELSQQAEQLTASLQTPFEKAQTEFFKVEELFNQGLINPETFGKAVDEISRGLTDKGAGEVKFASAATKGSQEARNLVLANRQTSKQESTQQKQLKEQVKTSVYLKEIRDQLKLPEPESALVDL